MKKLLILLVLATALPAAPEPNPTAWHFIIVDYAPRPPKLTKAGLWAYLRWLYFP